MREVTFGLDLGIVKVRGKEDSQGQCGTCKDKEWKSTLGDNGCLALLPGTSGSQARAGRRRRKRGRPGPEQEGLKGVVLENLDPIQNQKALLLRDYCPSIPELHSEGDQRPPHLRQGRHHHTSGPILTPAHGAVSLQNLN